MYLGPFYSLRAAPGCSCFHPQPCTATSRPRGGSPGPRRGAGGNPRLTLEAQEQQPGEHGRHQRYAYVFFFCGGSSPAAVALLCAPKKRVGMPFTRSVRTPVHRVGRGQNMKFATASLRLLSGSGDSPCWICLRRNSDPNNQYIWAWRATQAALLCSFFSVERAGSAEGVFGAVPLLPWSQAAGSFYLDQQESRSPIQGSSPHDDLGFLVQFPTSGIHHASGYLSAFRQAHSLFALLRSMPRQRRRSKVSTPTEATMRLLYRA